jgi:hypothetical protein
VSKFTLEERLFLADDHPDKIYQGLFISKLRRKNGNDGRIKYSDNKWKVDLRFCSGALHES